MTTRSYRTALAPGADMPAVGLVVGSPAVMIQRRLDRWLRLVPAVCASFLSKLSIPPFGGMGISLAIPTLCGAGAVGLLTGRLVVDPVKFVAWALAIALLWILQIFHSSFSFMSMLMLTAIHFPYILRLRKKVDYAVVVASYQKIAMVIACLGIAQYVMQFLVGPTYAFPIENLFPDAFKVSLFNMQGHLDYGSEVYRTNGVFMLEPSFYSQFLAVAVVLEAAYRRRLEVLALLLVGIGVSFSGTGLMLLAACVPCLAIVKRKWGLLLLGVVGVVAFYWVAPLLDNEYLNVFLRRSREFTAPGSSAFARFIGGFYLFEQFLWPDPLHVLIGFGSGALSEYAARANFMSGGNLFFKVVFEFGVLGASAYFACLWFCYTRVKAPAIVRIAVALTYLLGGAYIPFSHALAFGLLFWPNWPDHAELKSLSPSIAQP